MKKRFLTMFLALALCMGLAVPASAADNDAAVSGTCGKSTAWSFDKATGTLTISGTGSIDWSVGKFTFYYPWEGFKQEIRSVSIEEGVTSLGGSAFAECDNLAQITFPSTLREVGADCFGRTRWLENQRTAGDFILAGPVLLKYQGKGGSDTFAPDRVCTRGEIAAFLYRAYN